MIKFANKAPIWGLFLYSLAVCANPKTGQNKLKEVANGRMWHLLLHYKKGFIWGITGQADGAKFYFSPKGKTDPMAELKANIEAFKNPQVPGNPNQHIQCRFPPGTGF